MATRAVTDEQLQGISDAIKLKSGDDTPMSVSDMALRIGLIEGGGAIRTDEGQFMLDVPNKLFAISHNLGDVPKFVAIWADEQIPAEAGVQHCGGYFAFTAGFAYLQNGNGVLRLDSNGLNYIVVTNLASAGSASFNWQIVTTDANKQAFIRNTNAQSIIALARGGENYVAGIKYKWKVATW